MKTLCSYITEKFNDAKSGDEFYTRYKDIEKGLSLFDLSGKRVYCNCDNPEFSNFWKYLHDNFDKLGLRHLYATYHLDHPQSYDYNGEDLRIGDIESGRFEDNEDKIDLWKIDMIITNPPYSNNLPIALIEMCLRKHIDFIMVGPLHLITNKRAFELIKSEQLFSTTVSINKFDRPDGSTKNAPSCWWTNIYTPKTFKPTHTFTSEEYPKYDNYDAVDCKNYEDLPNDYDGVIGTSYRFICNLNKDDWEIVGIKRTLKLNGKNCGCKLLIKHK